VIRTFIIYNLEPIGFLLKIIVKIKKLMEILSIFCILK